MSNLLLDINYAPAVYAQSNDTAVNTQTSQNIPDTKQTRLDELFAELAKEPKGNRAKRISDRIWGEWTDSGSKSIDLLMSQANRAMNTKKESFALDVLDQVVTLAPEFAEGWNRRATVYFQIKDYGRSLADIEQTLKLEPRHFGALAGLATILTQLGKQERALETWYKILEVYPANENAQKEVIRLVEATFGEKV